MPPVLVKRNEIHTLRTVKALGGGSPGGRAVKATVIIDHNWDNGRGLNYDQTYRALAGLVKKGYLAKPARGYYRVSA